MKDIRIKISKEFPHLWVGIEASLDDMEDIQRGLKRLEDEAQEYHKSRYPHLYPDIGRKVTEDDFKMAYNGYGTGVASGGLTSVIIPTINRKYEEMEGIIKDCGTLEELAVHKEYCGKNPDLMPAYMNKLKDINDNIKKEIIQKGQEEIHKITKGAKV